MPITLNNWSRNYQCNVSLKYYCIQLYMYTCICIHIDRCIMAYTYTHIYLVVCLQPSRYRINFLDRVVRAASPDLPVTWWQDASGKKSPTETSNSHVRPEEIKPKETYKECTSSYIRTNVSVMQVVRVPMLTKTECLWGMM